MVRLHKIILTSMDGSSGSFRHFDYRSNSTSMAAGSEARRHFLRD